MLLNTCVEGTHHYQKQGVGEEEERGLFTGVMEHPWSRRAASSSAAWQQTCINWEA